MKNFGKMKTFVLHSYYFFKDVYCIGGCSIYSSAVAVYIQLPMQYIFIFRGYYPVWSVLPVARLGR